MSYHGPSCGCNECMDTEDTYFGTCWLCKEDIYTDRTESIRINNYDRQGVLKETYVFIKGVESNVLVSRLNILCLM